MAEPIYMSLTFPSIEPNVAEQVLKAAKALSGNISYSVFYDDPNRTNDDTQEMPAVVENSPVNVSVNVSNPKSVETFEHKEK